MVEKQRVFVAHRFDEEDIRFAIQEAMNQLGEITYFADEEVSGQWILYKLSDRIQMADAIIADISVPNPNIYFEIGMAIGYNKPVLLVANTDAEVPNLLEGFERILFPSTSELGKQLVAKFPSWHQQVRSARTEIGWCYFGGTDCEYRYRYEPGDRYLVLDQVTSTNSAGVLSSGPYDDFRDSITKTVNEFQDKPVFLDEVEPQPAKPPELCKYCIGMRKSKFVIANLASQTDPEVHILAGLSSALRPYQMFWMIHQKTEIPAVIRGIDFLEYKSQQDIRRRLPARLERFIKGIEPRPLEVELKKYLEENIYLTPEIEVAKWHPEDLFRRGRLLFFLGDISSALSLFQTVSTIQPTGKIAGWVTTAALCAENIEAARRGLQDFQELGMTAEPDYKHYVEIYTAWLETLALGENRWQSLIEKFLKDEVVWDLQGPAHVHFELALGLAATGYKLFAWRTLQRMGAYAYGLQEQYWWGLASMHPFLSLHADAVLRPEFEKWFSRHHPRYLPDLKPLSQVVKDWRNSIHHTPVGGR